MPFVAVTLLLGVVFGPTTPFVGDVYKNVADILQMLGEDGFLALIAIIIIAIYLKKNKFKKLMVAMGGIEPPTPAL